MNKIKEIAEACGWFDLGPQKQSSLMSFLRENKRANIWPSKMTVQIQDTTKRYDRGTVYKNVMLEELPEVLK